jgi:hypothetical protein
MLTTACSTGKCLLQDLMRAGVSCKATCRQACFLQALTKCGADGHHKGSCSLHAEACRAAAAAAAAEVNDMLSAQDTIDMPHHAHKQQQTKSSAC